MQVSMPACLPIGLSVPASGQLEPPCVLQTRCALRAQHGRRACEGARDSLPSTIGLLGGIASGHLVPSMTTLIEALPEHTSEESVPKKHGQHHIGHTWAGQSIKTPQGSAPCPKAGLQLFTAGAPMRQPGYSLATVWPDLDPPKPLVLSKIVTVSRISK